MKKFAALIMIACCFAGVRLSAQEQALAANTDYPKTKAPTENPTAPVSSQERVIAFKNSCEKSVAVFAGAREGIKDPKVKTFGGLSKNTLYLNLNDVVCLMNNDKAPIACTIIKDGISSIEVNPSATAITGK